MGSIANTEAITCCDAVVDSFDTGPSAAVIRLYSGTPPARVDAALSGNTLLAELTLPATSYGAAADDAGNNRALASVNGSITDDSAADAAGTVSFGRVYDGQASRVARLQFTAGEGSEEVVFNTASFVANARISMSQLDVAVPEG